MFVVLIRTVILYTLAIASVRVMGKRQLGELQPTELVITLLLSEIIATPIENIEAPLFGTIIAVFLLISLEIITSFLNMKSIKFRSLMQGHPLIVIDDGKINQKLIKDLRFTVDDLLEALRQKDVFDISTVQYAIVETNGQMSVLLKSENGAPVCKDLNIKKEPEALQCTVIIDGETIGQDFSICNMSEKKIKRILEKENINIKDVFLMTIDKNEKKNIILRDNNE